MSLSSELKKLRRSTFGGFADNHGGLSVVGADFLSGDPKAVAAALGLLPGAAALSRSDGGGGTAPAATPAVPTLDDARAKVEASTVYALKKRKGRAASILSDRPDTALGYTGGGMLATRTLGGAA